MSIEVMDEFHWKQLRLIERDAIDWEADQRRKAADPEEIFELEISSEPLETVFDDFPWS